MTIALFSEGQRDDMVSRFVQKQRRWMMYTYCFGMVCLTAGIVYGWPALRADLRRDNGWEDVSETEFGAAFTAGAWSTQGLRVLTGLARDTYGASLVTAFCLICVAAGSIGVALTRPSGFLLGVSLFLQGIGSGVQLCVQPLVAKLFPAHAGAVLASLSGAFQIAGTVYLVVTRLFASRRVGFLAYAGLVLGLALVALWLLPRGLPSSLPRNLGNDSDSGSPRDAVVRKCTAIQQEEDDSEKSLKTSTIPPSEDPESTPADHRVPDTVTKNIALVAVTEASTTVAARDLNEEDVPTSEGSPRDSRNNRSCGSRSANSNAAIDDDDNCEFILIQQIRSWKYFGLLQWFSFVITPLQYYVGSIGFQLEDRGDDTGKHSNIYSILYGCAAILSPACGYVADRYTLGIAHAIPTALCTVSFFMLTLDDDILPLRWQTVGLACNAVGRMWVFATFFAHVGRVFGYRYFGSLAGLGLLASAIVSLLQYPLLAAAADGHARLVNGLCGTVLLAELFYCARLHIRGI